MATNPQQQESREHCPNCPDCGRGGCSIRHQKVGSLGGNKAIKHEYYHCKNKSQQQESWLDKWDAEIMWWFYDQIELLFDATVIIDSTEIREKLKKAKKEAISTERQRVLDEVRAVIKDRLRLPVDDVGELEDDLLSALKEMEGEKWNYQNH